MYSACKARTTHKSLYAIKIMKSIIPLILVSLIISCANEEHTNKQDQINNKNEETVNPLKRIDSIQNIIDSNQREKIFL